MQISHFPSNCKEDPKQYTDFTRQKVTEEGKERRLNVNDVALYFHRSYDSLFINCRPICDALA